MAQRVVVLANRSVPFDHPASRFLEVALHLFDRRGHPSLKEGLRLFASFLMLVLNRQRKHAIPRRQSIRFLTLKQRPERRKS